MSIEVLLLTAIFTSWYGFPDTGYEQYTTYESSTIAFDCKHTKATGCLATVNGELAIVIADITMYASKGCTVQTHEFLHLMGFEEDEIPKCLPSTWRFISTTKV